MRSLRSRRIKSVNTLMSKKDAAVIKALEELGLRKESDPNTLPPELADLQQQLDQYEEEIGSIDNDTLKKFILNRHHP